MATESPARPGLSGPLRWLLVGSLALNLLVAGLVVGDALTDGGHRRHMELGPGPFARALDEEDRRAILGELWDRRGLGPPGREERRAAMAEILAAIRAEPFDRARAEAAMAGQAQRVAEVEQAIQAALLDRVSAMAPEERAAFAERLEAELGRGPGR